MRSMPATANESTPLIELEKVTKTYRLGDTGDQVVQALRGVDLAIAKGEFVAIMGASGSGKSNLLNILGCLDRPTSGDYRLEGTDVSRLDREELARIRSHRLGFVFQGFNLLARTTALENVELPLLYGHALEDGERSAKARAALVRVGLDQRLAHTPGQLSGGQQQRVAIARALVNEPAVLLADEPTGNLDSKVSAEIMALLQGLNEEGVTIVMVTHEPDIAQFAKRKIVLRDGAIVSDEPIRDRTVAGKAVAV